MSSAQAGISPTTAGSQSTAAPLIGSAIGVAGDLGMTALNQHYAGKAADKSKNLTRYFALRQYSMAMKGLRKAGLNPILAAQRGIGGFQQMGAPSARAAGNIGSTVGQGVQSALAAKRLDAELKNINADTIKKEEEATTTATVGANNRLQNQIMTENLEAAKAEAASAKSAQEFFESKPGRLLRMLDLFGRSVNPFTSAVESGRRATKR